MGPDGILTGHPYYMGGNLGQWKDVTGKPVGEEIVATAKEGRIDEIAYKVARPKGGKAGVSPEEGDQLDKVSFITRVDDQVCGVGYYK